MGKIIGIETVGLQIALSHGVDVGDLPVTAVVKRGDTVVTLIKTKVRVGDGPEEEVMLPDLAPQFAREN